MSQRQAGGHLPHEELRGYRFPSRQPAWPLSAMSALLQPVLEAMVQCLFATTMLLVLQLNLKFCHIEVS